MLQLSTIAGLRDFTRAAPRPLGLVPTMGALHAGHLALVAAAQAECASVVATIFVNPTQFGPAEDLARYPRPLTEDLAALEAAGVAAAFVPSVEEMFPAGAATTVHVDGPALPLEGEARPGHFDGVATVVAKLLLQAGPDRAYFGQKDGQQLAVVRRLAADLDMPVAIVAVPTVREADGLAVSSRNAYLSAEQREAAPALYRALAATRDRFRAGAQARAELEAGCRALLAQQPLIDAVDYVAAVDPDTMEPWAGAGAAMLAAAVRMGGVRLIDNVLME
ncbi:MAG: pantoate--beta-alanine ligase [Chloroflexi bacterium]|nr:pantoate--beta-alanine ligase [Chloroflexota bacterium]